MLVLIVLIVTIAAPAVAFIGWLVVTMIRDYRLQRQSLKKDAEAIMRHLAEVANRRSVR